MAGLLTLITSEITSQINLPIYWNLDIQVRTNLLISKYEHLQLHNYACIDECQTSVS